MQPARRRPPPPPDRRRRPSRRSSGRRRLLGVLAAVGLAVLAGAAYRAAYQGKVMPGVIMAGVQLGGATPEEARRRLADVQTDDRVVILEHGLRRRSISASRVGFRIDPAASAARALRAGREGVLDRMATAIRGLVGANRVAADYAVGRGRLERQVDAFADAVDRPVFPGRLRIDPATLRVAVTAPQSGVAVDRAAAVAGVLDGLRRGGEVVLQAPVAVIRGPSRSAAARVGREAREYLRTPLKLTGAGGGTTVGAGELARLLTIVPGDRALHLGARDDALDRLLRRVARRRDREPRNARITAGPSGAVLDAKGDVTWRPRRASVRISEGRSGRALDRAAAVAVIQTALRTGRHAARLAADREPPAITTAAARRVDRLIGTFTTRFDCCQPRVTNIRRMARTVDGTVIGPGATFSLNDVAGERTRAKGYVPAPYIAEGGTLEPSVGGGVSQFSTTMYNAAYFAGLDLVVHQAHSFYIDRYPPGREATLDFPAIDLVWINDTRAPVLVRASSTSGSVTVDLYGDNGGRRVRAITGRREALPDRDFAITVTREVRYPDGRVARRPHTTSYDDPPD